MNFADAFAQAYNAGLQRRWLDEREERQRQAAAKDRLLTADQQQKRDYALGTIVQPLMDEMPRLAELMSGLGSDDPMGQIKAAQGLYELTKAHNTVGKQVDAFQKAMGQTAMTNVRSARFRGF